MRAEKLMQELALKQIQCKVLKKLYCYMIL